MYAILILVGSLFLTGCAKQFPELKGVTHQHVLIVTDGKPYCFKSEIVSWYPYKLSEAVKIEPLEACNGLGGFLPDEMKTITNWMDDVHQWGKENKCYKN